MNNCLHKLLAVLTVLTLLTGCCAAAAEPSVPFIRMDRDNPDAWLEELDNVRFVKDSLFAFRNVNQKYGIDPEYHPDTKGLDTLCISGSAQFSIPQFRTLADSLRSCAAGRKRSGAISKANASCGKRSKKPAFRRTASSLLRIRAGLLRKN